MRVARPRAVGFAVGAALVAAVCTSSSEAPAAAQVSATGKGIAGGALLGGEIGFMTLAAAGAQQSWMYYTIPPALAIGGGIGGYFIEQSTKDSPSIPLFMLAGGMALVIPTVVITLSATTYRPGNEDATPTDASPAPGTTVKVETGSPTVTGGTPSSPSPATGAGSGGSTTTPPVTGPAKHKPEKTSLRRMPDRSFALVSWDTSSIQVGVPAVTMKPSYSTSEIAKFGLAQRYEVHAPLLDVHF
jgi:hypothetical protein